VDWWKLEKREDPSQAGAAANSTGKPEITTITGKPGMSDSNMFLSWRWCGSAYRQNSHFKWNLLG